MSLPCDISAKYTLHEHMSSSTESAFIAIIFLPLESEADLQQQSNDKNENRVSLWWFMLFNVKPKSIVFNGKERLCWNESMGSLPDPVSIQYDT